MLIYFAGTNFCGFKQKARKLVPVKNSTTEVICILLTDIYITLHETQFFINLFVVVFADSDGCKVLQSL